jgi:amidase
LLNVMAGTDPEDPATAEADTRRQDYVAALDAEALRGKRVGVLRFQLGYHEGLDARFEAALATLREAGAELVEISDFPHLGAINEDELTVLLAEFKPDLNAYLATTPETVTTRTLAGLIAFNRATPAETALFGQDLFERAEEGVSEAAYRRALADARRRAGGEGIDALLRTHRADALAAPSGPPAFTIDVVDGDHFLGSPTTLPAVAGYPHVTVPMGMVSSLPVGISFIGEAWSEARLLAFAFAYESRVRARRAPSFAGSIEDGAAVRAALAPAP